MKSNINLQSTTIGERIRYYRKLRGFTLKSMAHELEITSQQLQKYEKGVNRITTERLLQIANLLEVSIDTFFEQKPSININYSDQQLYKLVSNFKKISCYKIKKLLVENSSVFAGINSLEH